MLIRLLDSCSASFCCSAWPSLSCSLAAASSRSDDCSTSRRSLISPRSTGNTEAFFREHQYEGRDVWSQEDHLNRTFCSLLLRLEALLQLADSFLQFELVAALVRPLGGEKLQRVAETK